MSAKTGVYDTWKMLETIDQGTSNAEEAIAQLENKIIDLRVLIAEYDAEDEGSDERTASDMGFTLQLSLLQTVLALMQKP